MSHSHPTVDETASPAAYDVVVIGGGAAGLSGALALGRSRRSVLVLDAGDPRNLTAVQVHNYLGREGAPPAELLEAGRREVEQYGVEVGAGRVESVRTQDAEGTGFVVATEDGREVTTRRVLVASGVRDVLPEVAGLGERWGRDVLHCPYCHGWEVRDKVVAVVVSNAMAAHQARLFRQLTEHVAVVMSPGAPPPSEDDLDVLAARGVRFVADEAEEVLVADDAVSGLRLASGEVLACEAVVVSPRFEARADFLSPLGLAAEPFAMGELVLGTVVPADAMGATTVPGVYVAGNVCDAMAQVIGAAATGLRVGALINAELVEEEFRSAAADLDARIASFFDPAAWEERYGQADDVWSGRVNPQLEAESADLSPGRALDIGSGEGGDAIWLARRGWSVTGVDFSATGLAKAAARAEAEGVGERTAWRQVDVRTFDADATGERYDLVTSQFMHLPDGGMVDLTRRLAAAVAPGGTLLVVGHHPDDLATGLRQGRRRFMFTPTELLPALDEADWEVQVAEARPRTATGPDGEQLEVKDSVLRARRLGAGS